MLTVLTTYYLVIPFAFAFAIIYNDSGHIYSREAIVSYLLSQTQKLKEQSRAYEARIQAQQSKANDKDIQSQQDAKDTFLQSQSGGPQLSTHLHSTQRIKAKAKEISIPQSSKIGQDSLKRTSYWLSEAQPQYDEEASIGPSSRPPPPTRPSSPMSGRPLRRKDLIPITLVRDATDRNKVTCAASGNTISTQKVILITCTGVVLLQDVYDQLTKGGKEKVCPVTGRKFKPKHVLRLQKASSGFAASGETVAKKYRPTLT